MWEKYTEIYDDENCNAKLRFLDWEKGKVQVIDLPGPEHEYTVFASNNVFKESSGSTLPYPFATCGALKKPSYGTILRFNRPLEPTLVLPSAVSNIHEWMTFIVEVAFHTQPGRIDAKKSNFLTVPGMKYVFDLRVRKLSKFWLQIVSCG